MPELTAGLINTLTNGSESLFSTYDYLNDQMDQYNSNINSNTTHPTGNGPQRLAEFLQQLYSKMSDEKPADRLLSNSNLTDVSSSLSFSTSLLSMDSLLLTSTTKNNSYHILSIISFWIVLMVNPIVVKNALTPLKVSLSFSFPM